MTLDANLTPVFENGRPRCTSACSAYDVDNGEEWCLVRDHGGVAWAGGQDCTPWLKGIRTVEGRRSLLGVP